MTIHIDLIARLPKVELHCHLDGSLRISTILDLAKKNKVTLPATTTDGLSKILLIGEKRTSLERYLDRFELILSVLQTPESLKRAAYELIEDVGSENVRYIEIRYSPILHTKAGMTADESIDAVRKGLITI